MKTESWLWPIKWFANPFFRRLILAVGNRLTGDYTEDWKQAHEEERIFWKANKCWDEVEGQEQELKEKLMGLDRDRQNMQS